MIWTLWTMQLHAAVVVIGSAITLAFGAMVGHRIDFWIDVLAPEVGERLPTDAGAWAGLGVAAFVLLA